MKNSFWAIAAFALASCHFSQPNEEEIIFPADKSADISAKTLLMKMVLNKSNGYMVGHQDAFAYGHDWYGNGGRCDMMQVCGQNPAIVGWELGDLELDASHNLDSVFFDDMRNYIIKVDSMGAINTISWHLNNILTGKNAWDVSSSEVVSSILPQGKKHSEYLAWLDRFATFIGSLKRADGTSIPLIFRPYHELGGSWFWWGKNYCSVNDYISLWQMTFDYLTKEKNIHNLLYAYSMSSFSSEEELMERYPGDEYVDMIGFDIYQYGTQSQFAGELAKQSDIASRVAKSHNKLWAVTEGGSEQIPDDNWFTNSVDSVLATTDASYILFWRNAFDKPNHFYIPYKGHTSETDFRNFVSSKHVLTAKDLCD